MVKSVNRNREGSRQFWALALPQLQTSNDTLMNDSNQITKNRMQSIVFGLTIEMHGRGMVRFLTFPHF